MSDPAPSNPVAPDSAPPDSANRPETRDTARASLTGLRWLGLAGSVLLAGGAWRVGALPGQADADALPDASQAIAVIAAVTGLLLLTYAWWRLGTATRTGPRPTHAGRWMVFTGMAWAAPLIFAPPLASRDVYAYACQGTLLRAGVDPHQHGPAALPCPWLDSVPAIWRDAPSPYGPVASLISHGSAVAAESTGGQLWVAVGVLRAVTLAAIALAIWAGWRLTTACGVDPARAAWLALASPLVLVHAVSGAHLDVVLASLVLVAFVFAAPPRVDRPDPSAPPMGTSAAGPRALMARALMAGVMVGLAAAVKVTAVVVLPFLVLLIMIPDGRQWWRRFTTTSLAVVVGGAASFAATAALTGVGLGFLRGLGRTGELAQWTSPPTAIGMSVGYPLRAIGVESGYSAAITVARALGLLVAATVVIVLWWRAGRLVGTRPDRVRGVVHAAGAAFAAVTLLGPVFYPWYVLAPLALLAVSTRSVRAQAWLGAATALLAWLILPNGVGLAPRTKLPGALLVTVGVIAVARWWRRGRGSATLTHGDSGPAQPNPQ